MPAVADGGRVRDGVPAPGHRAIGGPVSESKTRAELARIGVLKPVAEDQRSRTAAGAGVGFVRIDHGHPVGDFIEGADDFPAQAQQEAGESVAGFVGKTGEAGLDRAELGIAGTGLGAHVVEVIPVLISHPEGVGAFHHGQVVLEDPAPRVVSCTAGVVADFIDPATLPFIAAVIREIHGREIAG